ncbi:MAG: hypothetical protein QM722_00475 [Piscinibacter sp.]
MTFGQPLSRQVASIHRLSARRLFIRSVLPPHLSARSPGNALNPMTMDGILSADDVARAQRTRRWTLSFAARVEARFEADTAMRRLQVARIVMLRTVVIYNLFLIGDFLLARDAFGLSLVLHFSVVTPWILVALTMIGRPTRPLVRNLLVASVPLAMVGGIVAVFSMSRNPDVTHYQYFVVISVMFGNVVLRPAFAHAVAASAIAVLVHAAACFLHPMMPPAVAVIAVFGLIVSAARCSPAGISATCAGPADAAEGPASPSATCRRRRRTSSRSPMSIR